MRHRFYDPTSKKSRNNFIRQAVFFFIGWNGLGYLFYQYVKDSARKKDADFDSKTPAMQYLSIIGKREPDQIKYYRYSKKGLQRLNPDGTVKVDDDITEDITEDLSKTDDKNDTS